MITLLIAAIVIIYLTSSHLYMIHMTRKCNATKNGMYSSYKHTWIVYPYVLLTAGIVLLWLFIDDIIRWKKYKFWRKK